MNVEEAPSSLANRRQPGRHVLSARRLDGELGVVAAMISAALLSAQSGFDRMIMSTALEQNKGILLCL